ncbi:hypothetical protein MJO28_001371 [Puccinia striiformis f. sp. tritici]|uniref:Phosphatidylinositol N-acetylglucosaminyltransferase subunit H conserved domain-containing protein n=3 Tax=Puccinia striiformis TaxID=27350 RepID=A0A2S4UWT6_9BASI|nr:hypothetical protein MJO28_001371 [Puccinia striiformis f. sp. tritici]POW01615.1 hypothetical protein PSHT_12449 [Puccinia striiformis]POW16232.1 hypothetical protein PSTT_01395 [Puccinia striiformis]
MLEPSSTKEEWKFTIQHFSPTTRLYTLHSNRPVFRTYQDAFLIALISILIPHLTWQSPTALLLLIFITGWIGRKLATVTSGSDCLRSRHQSKYVKKEDADLSSKESVLILGPLGIQFSSTTLMGVRRRFIAREHIRQAIIHEAIVGWNIVFYLGLVVEPDGSQMYIHQVFNNLQPQLNYLVIVWKGIREILFTENIDIENNSNR